MAVGKVVNVQLQLLQGAEHTVGHYTSEKAAFDGFSAGQHSAGPCHRHHVAHMDVPRAGDYLDGGFFAHVYHGDEHMVGIGMLFDGQYLAHHHVFDLRAQIGGDLLLGAGHGHSLRKLVVGRVYLNKFVEPVS